MGVRRKKNRGTHQEPSSTFCPGVGAMKMRRSLTEPEDAPPGPPSDEDDDVEAAESPFGPDDADEGKISSEIRMARYLARCSTRAVVVVLMNLEGRVNVCYNTETRV